MIGSGGTVAPERFQYLLWTVVAIAGFLLLILRTDPGSLTELPKIPDSLLLLTGVSSAGYLGESWCAAQAPS